MTGEEEDTDVGFPGPGHYIAEREWPMKIAMGILAFGAIVGGVLQIPGVDRGIERFLDPTFADSKLYDLQGSVRSEWIGLIVGALIAVAGITIAYRIWVKSPQTARSLQERFAGIHTFLLHKWYFDELIDLIVVRPALWIGRFADGVLERIVISGTITDGTVGIVRAGSAAVRRLQTGFLRYYAAALILGISLMTLYFLISSS
jgi:NADH-quinone oxidoreductase subunit L